MLNSVVCPVKEDGKEKEMDIPRVPSTWGSVEIENQDHTIISAEDAIIQKLQEKSDNNIAIICASNQKPLISSWKQSISSDNDLNDDDDDDGFKTPTSLDHRIPVMNQCPPPPRKRKVSSRKRKLAPPLLMRTRLQLLDASQEIIDSMFPQRDDKHHKIKKTRTK